MGANGTGSCRARQIERGARELAQGRVRRICLFNKTPGRRIVGLANEASGFSPLLARLLASAEPSALVGPGQNQKRCRGDSESEQPT